MNNDTIALKKTDFVPIAGAVTYGMRTLQLRDKVVKEEVLTHSQRNHLSLNDYMILSYHTLIASGLAIAVIKNIEALIN